MRKLDISEGIKFALFMAAVQITLPVGSYIFGCAILRKYECSIATGIKWISLHPVFSSPLYFALAVGFVSLGFLTGAFVRPTDENEPPSSSLIKGIIAWVTIISSIVAFVLWGLPES